MKKINMEKVKEVGKFLFVIFLIIFIRLFVITPAIVDGSSMRPNLEDKDLLILNKFNNKIERFDIIVIKHRDDLLIKRVIGMPGEHVKYEDGQLYINNIEVQEPFRKTSKTDDFDINYLDVQFIPRDSYFVVGDNRDNSQDSRFIGFIDLENIVGKTNLRLWPLNKIGKISK